MNACISKLIPAALTAVFGLALMPAVTAQSGNSGHNDNNDDNALVYSPGQRVSGRSYGEWSAEWWE